MADFFERRDPWGHGLALWVLLGLVFALPVALWGVCHVHVKNDTESWLSEDDPANREFEWYRQRFPDDENLILTWEGSFLGDPRLETLAGRLEGKITEDGIRRGGLKQVRSVSTPKRLLESMTQNGVAPDEALRRVQGNLTGPGQIRVRLTSSGEQHKTLLLRLLTEGAEKQFGLKIEISDPFDIAESESDEEDRPTEVTEPAPETDDADQEVSAEHAKSPAVLPESAPYDFQVSWPRMFAGNGDVRRFMTWAKTLQGTKPGEEAEADPWIDDCFTYGDSPAGLSVTLSNAGLADIRGTIGEIRRLAAECGVEGSKLHVAGTPACAAEFDREIANTLWSRDALGAPLHRRSLLLLAGAVALVLTFWLVRSPRAATVVLLAAIYAAAGSAAVIVGTGESMTLLLAFVPVLTFTATMLGATQIVQHWKRATQRDRRTAIVVALRSVREPVVLATVIVAVGVGIFMASELPAVRSFGFHAVIGLMIALFAAIFGVPALLQIWQGRTSQEVTGTGFGWDHLGAGIVRFRTPIALGTLITLAALASGLGRGYVETKVIRYFSPRSQIVQDYAFVENNLAGIVPVELVICFGKDTLAEKNFLDRMELVRSIEEKVRTLRDVSGTLSLADFQPLTAAASEKPSRRETQQRDGLAKRVEESVKQGPLASHFVSLPTTSGEFHAAGDELWRITARVAVMSELKYAELTRQLDEICRSETRYLAAAGHIVTGITPVFLASQDRLLSAMVLDYAGVFGIVAIVMAIALRHPAAGLLATFPSLAGYAAAFGLMAWCGIPLSVGSMFAAAVGLTVTVFASCLLLTEFREAVAAGTERSKAVIVALRSCGPAIWQTGLVLGISLGTLSLTDFLLINRFGALIGSLIGAAFIANLILAPALLASPLGALLGTAIPIRSKPPAMVHAPEVIAEPHLARSNSTVSASEWRVDGASWGAGRHAP